MNVLNIDTLLTRTLVGNKISKQSGIPEDCWGATVLSVIPCDLNYGCDCGYIITTTKQSFTIHHNQDLFLE